jgi:GAF domain-containing protein
MELPLTVLDTLEAEGERACRALGVTLLSISVWERDAGILRTVINVGELGGAEARPAEEIYPVHSFPALVTLLEHRTPFCFGHGDRVDVSSASLVASLGLETQAAAPISLRGEVWGSLWIATAPGTRPLTAADLPRVVRAANEIARALG